MLSNRRSAEGETAACKDDVQWKILHYKPFFIFPDNFTPSILIAKNIPPGGQGSGATAPPNRSEAKISKLTLFRAAPATKRLDPEVQWWLYFVRQRVL